MSAAGNGYAATTGCPHEARPGRVAWKSYDSPAAGCYAPGMNVLKELRFRFGSARRARELHESIENNHTEIGRLRGELDSEKANARDERTIVERFHNLYYEQSRQTWQNTYWMGTRVMKAPSDLWVYQEIIHETKPDLVLETGTALGGSALYLANLFDVVGKGRVVTVDLEEREGNPVPSHGRIRYLYGSSVEPRILEQTREAASGAKTVLVILDSDHSKDHVLDELRAYAPLVSEGSYLIVEDSNVGGHPTYPEFGPGPMEAIEEFLAMEAGRPFEVDRSREKFYLTFNPKGYLRRLGKNGGSGET